MEEKLKELKEILGKVADLQSASSVMSWDQQTYMPPGGAEARGQAMATISQMAQEMFTDEKVGKLLEDLAGYEGEGLDSDDARLIVITQREYDKATKVPPEMIAEQQMIQVAANQAWAKARAESDWSIFEPHMEKVVDFIQRYTELFKPFDHPYDALLDDYEPKMKTADVKAIFEDIRPKQVELIEAITAQPQVDDSCLHQNFPAEKQLETGVEVMTAMGYDWERGRQDAVHHPFTTNLGYGDQRVTYRIDENFLNPYLFASMHEGGHAMYEQGSPKSLWRTPLYGGTSLAIHESQSRLWENLVGRSMPFWEWYYPKLQAHYPQQLKKVSLDEFYKAINIVKPSLIRVEADEATYNLHIMLRMEIEIGLLDGEFTVKELPEVWNTRFQEYLGLTPPDDAQGVLQDVHWSYGALGYFSTYALGNLVSVQLWEKMKEDHPDVDDQMRKGNFEPIFTWMKDKVHQHGSKFYPQDLMQRIAGSKIDGGPYIEYLKTKYSDIYGL